jgi:transposase
MSPIYGRCFGQKRLTYSSPYFRGNHISMISAISVKKVEAALYGRWHTNGEIFKEFIREHLSPVLRKNHVVVYDNVSFHKNIEAINIIKSKGARVVFLPPYSPELNPIELMWSKVKMILRTKSPRSMNDFQNAICIAFKSIKEKDLFVGLNIVATTIIWINIRGNCYKKS